MQGKTAYIRPKVAGLCASRSYMHGTALFSICALIDGDFFITVYVNVVTCIHMFCFVYVEKF
jgi:hypothetical protein